ncbi:hypothetical protein [Pseudomonas sp. EA_35y_Pfl2_R5]|uniref:hypothetical protein n=1 Tax=Pseudomonas sp. EA_35y_Pfl2_R5 TaxID=3088690 RepID=UPI0030D99AB7
MDFIASLLSSTTAFFTSIDYTPLKQFIDLNDARNLAAIVGVIIAIYAASKKWGTSAIYQAKISYTRNRPARVTNISIANLKDKPLVVYEVLAKFDHLKAYVTLQRFEPPLVIEGLQATSFEPDDFSGLNSEKNPFEELKIRMNLVLVTESTVVTCKPAKLPATLVRKHLKGFQEIGKFTNKFNGKVYSREAAYAVIYPIKGVTQTSFILHSGFIYGEWPFQYNAISPEDMKTEDSVRQAVEALAQMVNVPMQIQRLDAR